MEKVKFLSKPKFHFHTSEITQRYLM